MSTSARSAKPAKPDISLDQAIKDLLTRYPMEAWRFLLPDLARKLGNPVAWEVLRSEAGKHDSPLVFRVGKLDEEERELIMTKKSTLPEPKLFNLLRSQGEAVGEAKGERTKALDTARKLQEHGISWVIITDSTGIKPADLKKASKK